MAEAPSTSSGDDADSDSDLLDPRRILVFDQVARSGSMAAAAEALGWTQPAVAQHIRRLERDAGCALVVRTSRGVTLTEAGRTLAGHAAAVRARLQAARADLTALAELRAGVVRIAAFPSACATFVPQAIAHLRERAPGLDVRLTEADPDLARRLLAAGEVDLAATFAYDNIPEPPAAPGPTALFEDPVMLVLPAGHRLADGDTGDTRDTRDPGSAAGPAMARLADATGERWIAGCPTCRLHLITAAGAEGFRPDIRHSTDDYVVTQTLVAAGLGVALLPLLALEAARDPRVSTVALRRHPVRHVSVSGSADIPSSAATAAVIDALLAVTAERRTPGPAAGQPPDLRVYSEDRSVHCGMAINSVLAAATDPM